MAFFNSYLLKVRNTKLRFHCSAASANHAGELGEPHVPNERSRNERKCRLLWCD